MVCLITEARNVGWKLTGDGVVCPGCLRPWHRPQEIPLDFEIKDGLLWCDICENNLMLVPSSAAEALILVSGSAERSENQTALPLI